MACLSNEELCGDVISQAIHSQPEYPVVIFY